MTMRGGATTSHVGAVSERDARFRSIANRSSLPQAPDQTATGDPGNSRNGVRCHKARYSPAPLWERYPTATRAGGFTLPELVILLVIIGILAAFAAPRLNVAGFRQQIFADEATNAIRHARKVALHSGCAVQVNASSATGTITAAYTGAGGSACPAGALPHPTRGGAFTVIGEIATGATFAFDGLGRSGGARIVTGSGDTIFIEPGSGYVHR